ncbi:MAG: PEGA domain-containing protein [bacterium]
MKRRKQLMVMVLLAVTCSIYVSCDDDPVSPAPPVGSILVKSVEYATVYIDGRSKGRTGLDSTLQINEVLVGDRVVKVTKHLYADWVDTVTVAENQTKEVVAMLVKTIGNLVVYSEPAGAKIYLDGYSGSSYVTPWQFVNRRIGDYELKLTLTNYSEWMDTVRIGSDSTTVVNAVMEKLVGGLAVTSEPAGAAILLDGVDLGIVTPATVDSLLANSHELRLTLPDYYDYVEPVAVQAFDTIEVHAVLQREVGNLYISSDPHGAAIWLDGSNSNSETPHTFTGLETGWYHLELVKYGYDEWSDSALVATDQTTNVSPQLNVQHGSLHVQSAPSGAAVWLDGTNTSQITPCTFEDLTSVMHRLKLTLADYKDYEADVQIIPFDNVFLAIELDHEVGSLNINSDPQAAHITLDGVGTGLTTPYTLDDVWTGSHRLSLSRVGYTTWDSTVTVNVNVTTVVNVDLTSIYGKIVVLSSPAGAAIYLGYINTGLTTPDTLADLNPGTYVVKLTLPAYLDHTETVLVTADQETAINVQLEQAPTALIIESVPSGAEICLNGSPTGYVTPHTLEDISPGQYYVRTLSPNHFPADTTIQVVTGYTHTASLHHDFAPTRQITYTVADTVYMVSLDGIYPQVLSIGYDSWIDSYVDYPGDLLWSPDGEYLVFTGLTSPVTIISREGDLEAGLAGSRSMDFDWSHDSRYLVYGHYRSGVYWYDTQTDEYKRIMSTWCYCWDHCPTYAPGDSVIAFIHQEYGTRAYLCLMSKDGTGTHRVSNTFGTGFDEDINLTWINDRQLIFETGSGIYLLDLIDYTDTTLVSPVQVVSDNVSLLRLSNDKSVYAYVSSTGLHHGTVGDWGSAWLIKYSSVYDFSWSPLKDAIACRTGDGVHWLLLNGTDYHIIANPTAGRGAVSVKP